MHFNSILPTPDQPALLARRPHGASVIGRWLNQCELAYSLIGSSRLLSDDCELDGSKMGAD